MNKAHRRGNVVRVTALTAALLGVYGPAFADGGTALTVDSGNSPATLDSGTTYTNVVILDGGTATGTGSTITGSEYELAQVNPGGSLTLTGATITNTVGDTNGRAVSVDGAGGKASLTNSSIVLNTNNGTYAHAFTAGVGVQNGGHADIDGGTITTTGSKRTVGIQANDGGSIDAKNVVITTDSTFGHAVNAYTDPAGDGPATVVTLDHVTVNTGNVTYADGIQSANKGASVVATNNTNITTRGTGSFGAEVFNGATVSLTGGSITTSGANAAGVRAYAGDGNTLLGEATVDGTTITTSGKNAIGVMAGDLDGSSGTAGIATLSQATINTSGQGATGIQANYGGTITSTGSTITTTGSGAHAAAALNGSSITLDDDALTAQGTGYGLYVTGDGSTVTATNGTTIETGNGKYAVEAADGGQVSLSGGSVTNAGTVGDRTGIYATGDGTSVTTHDVAISNSAPGLGTGDLSNVVSAANNATVELNGGTVASEGSTFGRGLLASSGATITANDVDISTVGTLSNAVHAFSADEGATGHDTLDSASINLDGGTVSTTGANSYGLSAQNYGAVITATDTTGKTSITTTGANSFGASAYNGGALDLTGVTIDTKGTGADGIAVNETLGAQSPSRVPTPNVGSTLTLKDSSVTSEKANGIYVGKDSTAKIENTDISAAQRGMIVQDGGSAIIDDTDISAAGSVDNRGDVTHAVDVTAGGTATITGGTITTTGANFTTGIFAASTNPVTTADATVTANNVAISTMGDTGVGVRAYGQYENQAELDTAGVNPDQTVNLNGGSITTTGTESYGIWAQDMGSHIIAKSYTDGSSVVPLTITTSGEDAYGALVFGGADAELTDVAIKTSGDSAYGVSLNAVGPLYRPTANPTVGATFTMSGGSISTSGDSADGLYAALGSTATLTDTDIDVTGVNASGVYVTSGSSATLTGGSVSSIGNDWGTGLYANGTGSTLNANGVDVVVQRTRVSSPNKPLGVGYEAKGGGSITLTNGSVTTKNDWNDGLLAYRGTITADGTVIQTDGTASTGVKAWRETSGYADSTSSVALTGGSVKTLGDESYGLLAQNYGSSVTAQNLAVSTSGSDSYGVDAYNGGSVALTGVSIDTAGSGAYGVALDTMSPTMRPASDGHDPTVRSTFTMSGGSITTSGDHAAGVYTGFGDATLTGTAITTHGLYGYGAFAQGGGIISLDGGSVTTANPTGKGTQDGDGSRAYALYADGADSRVTTTNGTTILTQGQRAYGAYATNGANVTMNGGSITTNGFMAYGLYSSGAGSTVDASNVDITTTGDVGDAVWAYQGGVTTLTNGTITVGGDPNVNPPGETANGLVAVGGDGGAIADGTINATGITLVTKGANSVGALAGAQVGTSYTSGTINLDSSSITVQGANSVAAEVDYGSTLTADNGTKLVSQQGDGIVMTGNATVNLTDTTVEAAGASLVSNLDGAGQEQNITIGSGSTLTKNDGRLLQVNRTSDAMDGDVHLTLAAGSTSHGDIVDLDGLDSSGTRTGGGVTNFTVDTGATWSGVVRGINDTTVEDGASATNDAPTTVTGNVATGTNTTVTYNDSATIGGGVSTGSGSTAVFNGTTEIGSTSGSTDGSGNVNGTNSSLTFNGATTIHNTVSGTGSNLTFNGDTTIGNGISGSSGTHFVFSKTGTTIINGGITLDGGSTTHGGTVDNLITVNGDANVTNGATLGGDLNIQGTLNLDGGTIGPGNSVGTITATSLTGAGLNGTYHAEVNSAGKSDLIHITTGTVDLSHTKLEVAQENGNGGYVLNHDYTILQADGGLVATFQSAGLDSSLAGSLVKLDPIEYGTNDVKISLSLDTGKVNAFSGTSNQESTLGGVMSVAGKNTAADAALSSTDTTGSLDQLSGESHASTQSVLLASGGLVQNTLFDRLRGNLGAGMLPGEPVAQASGPLPASAMPRSAALPLWFQVVGNWSTLGGTSNTAPVSTSTGGVFLGGDTPVGDGWRIGGAFGYTNSNIDVDDRSSDANVNSYTAALYGGKSAPMGNGRLKFMAGVGVTRNNVDSRRTVTLGGSQTLKAFYHADSAQVFSELGYAMPLGADMEIEPYAGVAFQSLHTQGFDESGGDAALSVNGETDNVTTTTLGLRGKKRFDLGAARQAVLSAGLGWRHAMGDITPTSQMAFITGGGTSFNVEGAPVAEDAAVVDVSGEMVVGRDAAVGLRYNGQFGSGSHDNSGTLYLKVRFK